MIRAKFPDRMIAVVSAFSLILSTIPVTALAAIDQPLARSGSVRLISPEVVGGWCKETAVVRALTPTTPIFTPDDPVSQGVTRALGVSLPFECPTARAVRIEGVTDTGETFVAAAEAGTGWRLFPPGALISGPVTAQIDPNGFMPTHWAGTVNVQIQDVTRDAIREHSSTERGGLYPQPDGRIRVNFGRCDGQLALVTRTEIRESGIRLDSQERLYKIVQPSIPFETGGQTGSANCAVSPTVTNWLVLATQPDSVINVRAIVRNTEDGARHDSVTIERVMGALSPVYPPVPQTIAEAQASASTEGPDLVGAGMLLMVGLLAAAMWPGGGFSSGGHDTAPEHDDFDDYMHDKNLARDQCYAAGGSICE